MKRNETPTEHLLRLLEEAQHRELDRLERRQRLYDAKQALKRPFRWLHDLMTGM